MARQLEHPHLALGVGSRDAQRAAREQRHTLRIHPEVAVVLLDRCRRSVDARHAGAGRERQPHLPAGQRAGERRDEEARGIRIVLGVLRVAEAEHVACVLEHHVLESAACAQARHTALARRADRPECELEVLVGAAGGDPHGVEALEEALVDGGRGDPRCLDGDAQSRARVRDGCRRRPMGGERGAVFAENRDGRHVAGRVDCGTGGAGP